MSKFINILKVAFATIGSRILGLVRDALSMAYMSIGAVSSAYTFAFTLPNLFRRLLGEGALSSAIVPIFSGALKNKGLPDAFDFLNKATSRAIVGMIIIVTIGMLLSLLSMLYFDTEQTRYFLGAKYSLILFPYLLLICVAAIFSAVLNVLDSFGIPSITPIILNVCIIAGLFCGVYIFGKSDIENIALCMSFSWLVGGFFQMTLPAYCLIKRGWKFKFDLRTSEEIKSLYALFVPALIGAAVVQLNIFISKLLAFNLNDSATPALYISSRILEFPLGVFSIAIATVYFPRLAKLTAQKRVEDFRKEYDDGLIASMAISIPAMFGIIVLAKDILGLLFQWGLFSIKDVDICLPILIVSVVGLPFFAFTTYATRGFHSNSDTKTPVKISYIAILLNILFSILLMFKFEAVGLAAANVFAAIFTSIALHFKLKEKYGAKRIYVDILKIIVASLIMTMASYFMRYAFAKYFDGKLLSTLACCIVIPLATVIYLVMLKVLKFQKLSELKKLLRHK